MRRRPGRGIAAVAKTRSSPLVRRAPRSSKTRRAICFAVASDSASSPATANACAFPCGSNNDTLV
jgi:hypothetical protein